MTQRASRDDICAGLVLDAAGVLCGAAGTADVIDASVVLAARRHQATVVSSDRPDLRQLDPTIPLVDC